MSYADDLAKDRDKYLAERNAMARALRALVEACDKAHLVGAPIDEARKHLAKIDNAPEGMALLRR